MDKSEMLDFKINQTYFPQIHCLILIYPDRLLYREDQAEKLGTYIKFNFHYSGKKILREN